MVMWSSSDDGSHDTVIDQPQAPKMIVRPKFFALLVLELFVPIALAAQDQATPTAPGGRPATEPSDSGVYGREIFIPKPPEKRALESPAATFAEKFLRGTRQHVGLSVSIGQLYSSGVAVSSDTTKSVSVTQLSPELYLNFQKKQWDFRLTYGVLSKRYYGGLSDLNRLSQNGSASLSYTRSGRKTTLRFANSVSSTYNDEGLSLGAPSSAVSGLDAVPAIYLDRRRETTGIASVDVSRLLTRKGSVTASLTYDSVHYSGSDLQRASTLSAGVGATYRINNWLSFDSHYYRYLINMDQRSRDSSIHNLQLAQLSFRPRGGWLVSFSGGLESTKAETRSLIGAGRASVSKTTGSTKVELGYHRGYFSVFPTPDVVRGDTANLRVVQSLSRIVILHANGSYIRATSHGSSYLLDSLYGGGGIEIALQNQLVFSTDYYLVSQKFVSGLPSQAGLHRYSVVAGLRYYLPSFRTGTNRE